MGPAVMTLERDSLERARPASGRGFVGRARELDELDAGLSRALNGRGCLYLVSGEPGIGKTRLCDELTARAESSAGLVYWGRCWEAGGAPAYYPWLELLSGLADSLGDAELAAALGDGQGGAVALLPQLAARLPAQPTVPGSPEQARFCLFRALTNLVRRAAACRGALLVFEDLHAADESSLKLLHFLARELRSVRALVIGTRRDVDARITPEIGNLLSQLEREASVFPLARLDPAESAEFVRTRAASADPRTIEQLVERTQGNPLFLEQLVSLVASGRAAELAEALPAGVLELIRQRLSRLCESARELLELGAVLGDEVDPLLVSAISERPLEAVLGEFDEAARAGVVALHDQRRVRFRFTHALVREVLVRDLAPARRAELHGRAADAVGRRAPAGTEPAHAELAHHLLEGPVEALPRAVDHAVLAAERALSLFAFEDAISLLSRARLAAQRAGDPPLQRVRLLTALGRAKIRRGDGAEGQALCLEACEASRSFAEPELFAAAALAYGLEITSAIVNPTLVRLLEEALGRLPEADSALRVQVAARLAAAMQPHSDPKIPIALAERAVASARRIGDPRTLLGALYTGMSAMMDIVDPRERLPKNLEIEALAESLGEPEALLRTQARLVFDHMELGDFAAADARIDHFERLSRELRAARYAWRVPLFRSMRAMIHGRFEESEAACERARELGLAAGDPQLDRCYVFHREGLLRAWERHADMRALDPDARRMRAALYSGPHWQNGGSAFTYSRLEDYSNTRLYLELLPQDDWPLVHNPPAFQHLGEPLALAGAPEPTRLVYELLLGARHRSVSWGYTKFLWEGPATRVLGLLAARLGLLDEARAHFDDALATLTRLEAWPLLARCRYELGRALAEAGHPGEGRAALEASLAEARALGMTGLVELAERRLSPPKERHSSLPPPGPRAPRPDTGGLPFSFTPEGEYWTVSYLDSVFRLRDSLGLQYLARLFAEPGRAIHVLELSGARDVADPPLDEGDAGELLDDTARAAYKGKLEELREELDEAERFGDPGRAGRAREQIEFLSAELSRAVGLGGRTRRAGGAGERARSAVQRRIRNALDRVRESSPPLADLLERSVKTGVHCVFAPESAPR
jgi:tetratricopeptide (TPR) repeat protein